MSEISVGGIAIGLLSNLIYDLLKNGFSLIRKRPIKKNTITQVIQERISSDFNDIVETDAFYSFIRSPKIHDYLYGYISYKVSSKIISAYQNRFMIKIVKDHQVYSDETLCNELAEELIRSFEIKLDKSIQSMPSHDRIILTAKAIITIINSLLYEQLSDEQLSQVFLINEHMDVSLSLVINKLDYLIKHIEKEKNPLFYNKTDEYETQLSTIHEYNSIIKDMCKNAHIYLMSEFKLADFYVSPVLSYDNDNSSDMAIRFFDFSHKLLEMRSRIRGDSNDIDWSHIFDVNNIIYIIGGAGYGKSLFMRYLIGNSEKMHFMDVSNHLIIYGQLKEFYQYNPLEPTSIPTFLQNCMVSLSGMDQSKITKELIQICLTEGRCIILLDALDEVPRTHREDLHRLIINFFKNQNPNNKICITSRARGFIPAESIHTFKIMPLTSKQVNLYVDRIIALKQFPAAEKENFIIQANRLIVSGFLTSFLILSLLVSIYKAEKELPETKLDLYQKCFDYIARKREMEKSNEYDWKLMKALLDDNTFMDLAQMGAPNNAEVRAEEIKKKLLEVYEDEYSEKNLARNAIDEFLSFCSERTEVYVPASTDDTFHFFHRSFYEYFFSKYIAVRINDVQRIYETLIEIDLDSEVFELVIARLKNENLGRCNEIINLICKNAIVDINSSKPSYIQLNILSLTLPLITNKKLLTAYIDILCNNASTIFKGRDNLSAQNNLYKIVKSDNDYILRICDSYREYVYTDLISLVDISYNMMQLLGENLNWKESELREMFFVRANSATSIFTRICIENQRNGVIDLLEEMQNGWLKKHYGDSQQGRKKFKRCYGHLLYIMKFIKQEGDNTNSSVTPSVL